MQKLRVPSSLHQSKGSRTNDLEPAQQQLRWRHLTSKIDQDTQPPKPKHPLAK
ncbi:unnamed protein product [Prunus armeniaca]|uniref:Uncharacterized protein n=1 Tax=Prunus armeniaca TaxID=36596 RepID=A0A6J5W0D7_PRUAR|nr:unnamed protein product [Prunus armeniaca]